MTFASTSHFTSAYCGLMSVKYKVLIVLSVVNVKGLVSTFNHEKSLVGAFSVRMSIFAKFRFQLYWHVCLVPGDHASVVWSVKSGCEGLAAVGLHSPALCTLLMVSGVILGFSIFVHIPITHFKQAAFMS